MKADHVRAATVIALLDDLDDVPVAVLDNKARSFCYTNAAFEALSQGDAVAGKGQGGDAAAAEEFFSLVQSSPSSSTRKPSSVEWRGKRVRIAWEESVEGEPVALRADETTDEGFAANNPKASKANEAEIYLPLLGKHSDSILTSSAAPSDQALDTDKSAMDMQLERSVWQCLLVEIPAACLITDVRGFIRFASRTLAEVFGIPPREKAKAESEHAQRPDTESSDGAADAWDSVLSLPRGCKGMLESGEEMRPTDYPLYKTVKNHEVVRGAEFKIKRADGSIGSIRSTSSPVYDQNNEIVAIVAVVEDVSATYDAREERDNMMARHRAAHKANELKDEFISRISHELRTPINGMMGLQELIVAEEPSEEREHYIDEVFKLADRMKVVVDDLLSATKSSLQPELEIAPHSMEDMIQHVIHTLANQARVKEVKVEMVPPVDPAFPRQLLTDSRLFKGIVLRLLDNSIRFSSGGTTITIGLELQVREEDGDLWVVLVIRDEGRGIENPSKIWEAFEQEVYMDTRASTGLGLGLTYVRNGVTRLGGQIEVARREPRGTSISIFWPMNLPPTADKPDRSHLSTLHRHKANTIGPTETGGDDNAQADQSEGIAATSSGFHVSQAHPDRSRSPQPDNKYRLSDRSDESVMAATTRKLDELDMGPSSATSSPGRAMQYHLDPAATRPPHARSNTERSSASSSSPVLQANAAPAANGATPVHNVQIVEDDPINAKILQKTFVKAGFNVTWAENGQIGFENCRETEFNLIIMDLMMPVCDGIESTKLIRQYEADMRRKPTQIVGFTAAHATKALEDCMAAGMDIVLLKPCSGKKLLDAVAPFLGK